MSLNLDLNRQERQGFPEVVYGEGKSKDQITAICKKFEESKTPLLITRLKDKHVKIVENFFSWGEHKYHKEARAFSWLPEKAQTQVKAKVCLLCAGSSDLAVISECEVTLRFLGLDPERIYDVGVAGIHRVLSKKETLAQADLCIVAAGMDGALPSVVGGLVKCPVIAVPTSVGYGAAFGGVSALLTMLNSCANGITVVNIDNGFGAAMAAWRILQVR
ncbi:MAG: nickel pincer cofactor biosynthesis protein LarB [Planctomycetes bacterium]|nr:nickel pincer cofactor biosynthesis protein LarB [Planctomycetota bacterium]